LLIYFYTQKFLFLEINIKSFSASHIINHVKTSIMKSFIKSSIKPFKFDKLNMSN